MIWDSPQMGDLRQHIYEKYSSLDYPYFLAMQLSR